MAGLFSCPYVRVFGSAIEEPCFPNDKSLKMFCGSLDSGCPRGVGGKRHRWRASVNVKELAEFNVSDTDNPDSQFARMTCIEGLRH